LEGLNLQGADSRTITALRKADRSGFAKLCAAGADLFEAHRATAPLRLTDIAVLRTAAGDFDAAFAALNEAADNDDPYLLALPHMPHLARLGNDPRFAALKQRIRFLR